MVEVIMQFLLSVVQANVGLCFGQRPTSDTAHGLGESGHSIGRLVKIVKSVLRLRFMVWVGGANGMDNGSPNQFPGSNIVVEADKFRSLRRQVTGCVEVRQRIQTDGSLRCAVSSSLTSQRMAGRNMAYSSASQ